MLQQPAIVESESPLSKEKIRVTVSPEGVQEVSPAGAVMSIVVIDTDRAELSTATDIQMNFCCNVHFFACRTEVEQWAANSRHKMSGCRISKIL